MARYFIQTPVGQREFASLQEAYNGAVKAANRWGISIGVFAADGWREREVPPGKKLKKFKKNPLFKRTPKHTREENGFILTYTLGGKAYRYRYANKGIATIKANNAKKDGAKSVKVVAG